VLEMVNYKIIICLENKVNNKIFKDIDNKNRRESYFFSQC